MVFKCNLFYFIVVIGLPLVSNIFFDTNYDINEIKLSDLDSEAFLDSFEALTKHGYTPEKHVVTTEDGYVLTHFRIPRKGPPVLLVHGITDSSDEWLVLGPNRSLSYQLADAGFDVWLFNSRGNRYSKEHIEQNIPKEKYWDFSLDEMGIRDLPPTIDYILNVTPYKKMFYIGFSQGTTIFHIMCSTIPNYNNKIKYAVLLAPVAWVSNIKIPLISVFSNNIQFISSLTVDSGLYDLLPFSSDKVYSRLNCYKRLSKQLCDLEAFLYFGLKNANYLPEDRAAVISSHSPAGLNAKIIIQYLQWHKSKRVQRFDHGETKNLEMYSTKDPPLYNISLTTTPVTIIASEIDWFGDIDDVKMLRQNLPNVRNFIMYNNSLEFSHLEFVYGSRVNSLVNRPILKILLKER
ncbi:unnamed protein product [Diatraea saccharalis]|uniref:Lipase n=1 Tax=Diatraea saccharalis TaxID=40085 RepID=A0A9N9RFK8_9NEOP|nr:unnamed protein product [Diatraea saccharalis]